MLLLLDGPLHPLHGVNVLYRVAIPTTPGSLCGLAPTKLHYVMGQFSTEVARRKDYTWHTPSYWR